MLDTIHVKNLALVDDITIQFHSGLNILTGETGAGKSVLMNSINLCLGEKVNKGMIGANKDFALVELSFILSDSEKEIIEKVLHTFDISLNEEDSNILYISRKIGNKSSCKINGELVNLKTLQLIGSYLLDAHSQHETSKLLNVNKHLDVLDESCGLTIDSELKTNLRILYKQWKDISTELENAKNEKLASNRELSLAQYEIEEIDNASLTIGEDEELESQYKIMKNGKNIYNTVNMSLELLSSDDSVSIYELINKIDKEFSKISDTNKQTEEYYSRIQEIKELASDLSSELYSFLDDCSFSEKEMYEVEQRLDLINNLKNKYGNTIEEILNYYNERLEYINKMENYEEYLSNLVKKEMLAKQNLDKALNELTKMRKEKASIFEKEVEKALQELNFNHAKFRINIEDCAITSNGKDKVEFMVVLNKGTSEQSLAQIASGGELSRIMLAIKSITAQNDDVNTLIFDEIDTGISGETAWLVGNKLYKTSIGKQVICITHLPQIAAFSDYHYEIKKQDVDDKAQTNIYELDNNGKQLELQRLSGVNNEDAVLSLIDKANKSKTNI